MTFKPFTVPLTVKKAFTEWYWAKSGRKVLEYSTPEMMVAVWLLKHKIDFIPQYIMYGGTSMPGGARVDFMLTGRGIVIRVQSYWHENPETRARDELQKIKLTNDGYTVVDIQESDIMENIDRVMEMAIEGRDAG